jgi:alpha-galactosidase/6-phospho-beta-glucosidase family protein
MFRFKHLPQVCMTYTTHMCLSLRLSALFFKGSVYAFIHAFIPDVLTKSSSTVNQTVTEIIEANGCRNEPKDSEL